MDYWATTADSVVPIWHHVQPRYEPSTLQGGIAKEEIDYSNEYDELSFARQGKDIANVQICVVLAIILIIVVFNKVRKK